MKKITLLTIFGLALMALSACNKEEETASRTLKLDLNIIHGSDTKAVKTGWESGDKIYVFFGKPEDHTTPAYLTLTYNGSSWTEAWTAGLEAEIASTASGKLHATSILPILPIPTGCRIIRPSCTKPSATWCSASYSYSYTSSG